MAYKTVLQLFLVSVVELTGEVRGGGSLPRGMSGSASMGVPCISGICSPKKKAIGYRNTNDWRNRKIIWEITELVLDLGTTDIVRLYVLTVLCPEKQGNWTKGLVSGHK